MASSTKVDIEVDSQADSWFAKLGPGLITGAADDDPSGIATYSQAGAQFGFNMLWTVLLTYPLMVAIQVVSARIGRVSGHGLATNLRRHYPRWLLYGTVVLLLVANTINIAADLTAMGEEARAGAPEQVVIKLTAADSVTDWGIVIRLQFGAAHATSRNPVMGCSPRP